jgi:tetratricopeptide (TPR) repeat protein
LRALGALLVPGEPDPVVARRAPSPPIAPSPAIAPSPVTAPSARPPDPPARAAGATATPRPGASASQPLSPLNASSLRRAATGVAPAADANEPKPHHDLSLPDATPSELAALREDVDLDEAIRRRILAMARLADGRDPWALLGVPSGAEPLALKRAYFRLSKEIHPDRYFGQRLGGFAERLPFVFEALSRAYARLTNPERARGDAQVGKAEQPQTPQEYAAELFDRACQLEVSGEHLDAMKLFAAAVRVDSQPRYLRRAASCALAANQPRSAVEYAKKAHSLAPTDPSSARLLAAAFRAAGKLSDAEEVLIMAMALKSENDVLTSELRHDLAEVRRLLAQ